jgi:site-specific DNA-methyltransferase (adenine-specific)
LKSKAFDHSKYAHWIDPNAVTPYEKNAKIHTDKQIKNIVNSIKRFGWQQDTVITADNVLVIGHGRRLAALQLGCEMPYHVIDKTADELTDEDIRELRIADNQTNAETGLDFDTLNIEIEDLDFDGFDFDFGIDTEEQDEEPIEIVEDEPPTETETRCKVGDLWQLGSHRLICGDSTDPAVIDRLMDGVKADMVFCDAPYGYKYESNHQDKYEMLKNDDKILDFIPAIWGAMKDNCPVYEFCGWQSLKQWLEYFENTSLDLKNVIIWKKNNWSMGDLKGAYAGQYEVILYLNKGRVELNGARDTDIWEFDREPPKMHPTMKPIELIAYALNKSSKKGDVVLDCFGGSGSTLIACEQLNRKCYMCELDEHYCSVIIQRWENFTGQKAVKLNNE